MQEYHKNGVFYMANCVIIMGPSGTGKSTSIKTLDPKETVIINVLGKKLPFYGSSTMYSAENKNIFQVDNYEVINKYLVNIDKNAPHVKNIICEDVNYVMRKEYFKLADQTGLTVL